MLAPLSMECPATPPRTAHRHTRWCGGYICVHGAEHGVVAGVRQSAVWWIAPQREFQVEQRVAGLSQQRKVVISTIGCIQSKLFETGGWPRPLVAERRR